MDKLKMQTVNKADENFKKLAAMFPNAVTETIDENGEVVRAIDKDVLMQEISCKVVDGNEERYQFTWPDKKKSVLLANAPINKTLRPVRDDETIPTGADSEGKPYCSSGSVDFDNTENLYIEGDNLEVLKLLQETYLGKIKMIYIDPPYNTGHDFVYGDDFSQSTEEYLENSGQFDDDGNRMVQNTESNGRFHTDWLNMLYPRIKLSKSLLRDDGVIFISIDDNEIDNLKKICNEIFGEVNLVAEIPWQSRASIQNDTDFSVNHEYICVYAKNRRQENRRLKESNYSEWHKKESFVCKPLPLDKSKFDNPDNDPRGLWKADPFDAPNVRPNLTYPVVNPNTGEEHLPPRGRHWRFLPAKFSSALEDNRIVWTNNGLGRPQLKVFYEEKKEFGSVDNSWFSADRIGTSTNGTKELMKLFDGSAFFDTPKPVSLLSKLITLANVEKDDIILDFFSGSATTAHAVMQLNAEDCGHRKFMMVQLPEVLDEKTAAFNAGYKNICEIGKERIRRATKKIAEENPEAKFDGGFRVLKCDTSNMKNVYYNPAEYEPSLFTSLEDNIKEDRTSEDLLFQVMLDLGVLLSSKIKETTIAGKKVFNVEDNYLIACFDDNVTEEVITEIAKQKPYYFVMRDSSMANDSVATNFEQIFDAYSPDTVRKVL
ncbi:site-specific DNA-methyltransferase [Dorea longicatena]|uniref:site-specific DNA-methyltransferase n=1 Tax=Dorea longicatena TaxID=88431 RepID=UPI00189E35C2|nr:site-specific DNA-methyltransferase [Dorea longicatena]